MEMLKDFAREQGMELWPELPTQMLPEFPVDVLPDDLAAYCTARAKSIQVSPAMVACIMFGTVSSVAVGRIKVQPMHGNSYMEPAQLYLICRGNPGERKSSTMTSVTEPWTEWITEKEQKIQQKNDVTRRKIEVCRQDAKRAKGADLEMLLEQMDEMNKQLLPDPISPLGDVTMEALIEYMSRHDGKAAVMTDEANILNVCIGRSYTSDKGAVNLDVILKGYSGNDITGIRVGRGAWKIKHGALSVCVAVQPNLLDSFTKDKTSAGRGLQGRFLYFLPESMVGLRQARAPQMPADLALKWDKTIRWIASLPDSILSFDEHAETAYIDWSDSTEHRLRGDLDGALLEWGGKLVGNTVRLAGTLALMDRCTTVQSRHWYAAQTIADSYLVPCAKHLFCSGDDRLTDDARTILDRIKEDNFSQADFWRDRGRHLFKKEKRRFEDALQYLQLAGYLRPTAEICSNGKTSVRWIVNPACLEKSNNEGEVFHL